MFKLSLAFSAASLVLGQTPITLYCSALAPRCGTALGFDAVQCETIMSGVPVGTTGDVGVNSLLCRQKFLDTMPYNQSTRACAYAGPSGGGMCGSVLDNTCEIAVSTCNSVSAGNLSETSYNTTAECKVGLTPFNLQWGATIGPDASGENSLECRLYHAIAGFTTAPVHCTHFGFNVGIPSVCANGVAASKDQYCDLLETKCNGTNTQFANRAQCIKVAEGYPTAGTDARNTSGHSLGCRNYHAQAAAVAGTSHCEHAGPTGAGQCGTISEAWGTIAAAAPCLDTHVNMFLKTVGPATLEAVIPKGLSATVPYSTSFDNDKNTQACRVYHLGVASTDITHCSHGSVSGNSSCGTNQVANLCKFIGGICGFGAASWQFSSEAVCNTDLALSSAITAGTTSWATSGNTHQCRFYHAAVAGSFLAGGSSDNATDAVTQKQTHCGHVLKTPLAGCNGPLAPTPKSGASAVSFIVSVAVVAFSVLSL